MRAQPATEIMIKFEGRAVAIGATIVEIRLAHKYAAIQIGANRIARPCHAVPVEVIKGQAHSRRIRWPPAQAAHQEFLIVARVIHFSLAIADLARQAVGERAVLRQIITEINADFFLREGSDGGIDLPPQRPVLGSLEM